MARYFKIVFIFLLLFGNSSFSNTIIIHRPPEGKIKDVRDLYYIGLLKLALVKSSLKYGKFKIIQKKIHLGQNIELESLIKNKHINIMWTMTSSYREKKLIPIRIPLTKGLLGHRVFLIKKSQQKKFSKISTLEQLRKFIAIQGQGWPDTKILKTSKLKVKTRDSFDDLFTALINPFWV